jgi:hypothetical protein
VNNFFFPLSVFIINLQKTCILFNTEMSLAPQVCSPLCITLVTEMFVLKKVLISYM